MNKYNSWYARIWHVITGVFAAIRWNWLRALVNGGTYYDLTPADREEIKRKLADNYYIILTYRKSHLTTYLIGAMTWLKTGRWPGYCHALMNVDAVTDPGGWQQFKFVEAEHDGVHFSTFEQVFDVDHVLLLQPRNMTPDEWRAVIDGLYSEVGSPYDDFFDYLDDSHLSCVEAVRDALRRDPLYLSKFADFEGQIISEGQLTPQLYAECPDFDSKLKIWR